MTQVSNMASVETPFAIDGPTLARAAVAALRSGPFETQSGYCERFIRQVVESVYPDIAFDQTFDGSASLQMHNLSGTRYVVKEDIGRGFFADPAMMLPGDMLFKGNATSGPSGHVGMFFHQTGLLRPDGSVSVIIAVAENSSFHIINPGAAPGIYAQTRNALGWRNLLKFGYIEMIVRLSK